MTRLHNDSVVTMVRQARRFWRQALDIFRDLGDPEAAEVQGFLDVH